MIFFRIIEKLLILYFALYLLIDIVLYLYALGIFSKTSRKVKNGTLNDKLPQPPVSIIVPAYNEEVSIVVCVKMLMEIDYENYQIIVVNDGSSDNTLQKLMEEFDLKNTSEFDPDEKSFITAQVKNVYSSENRKLLIIDKENGGKADSINSAINIAEGEFICTIDADSILDSAALKRVIAPLLNDDSLFVSGGQLALSNDMKLQNNRVVSAKMPGNVWVLWQILEYISTFMIARSSLSRINALLIMSGAFSIFRKRDLKNIGGFLTKLNKAPYIEATIGVGKQTITEDMEVVLRLWRYYHENKHKAKAVFVPGPVCWTEAPEKPPQLFKQRVRWHQGLAETLWLHKQMIFEPKYKITGMLAMPYYLFMELLAPVVKLFTLIFIFVMIYAGLTHGEWILLMIIGVILLATVIMSTITVILENWSIKQSVANREALRYKTFFDWIYLLFVGIIGSFSYAFFKMYAQLHGIIGFFRKRQEWNKFERKGIIK